MLPSSWISEVTYRCLPDGSSYLALFLEDKDEALLYGPFIPPWMPGLIAAGTGRRSVGLAYNRLLKGKYPYQRVVGRESVKELRKMLTQGEDK